MFLIDYWLLLFLLSYIVCIVVLVSIARWKQSSVSWEAEVNICQLSRKELWDCDEEPGCRLFWGSERVVTPLKQHISGIDCSESVWNDRRETVWQYVVEVLIESQKATFAVLDSSQVNSTFCNEPGQHDYGIGVDMAGILGVGGHMASAEGGVWGRMPLSSRLLGLGNSPAGPGWAPTGNTFWCILKATEHSFLYLHADALSNLVLEISKHYKIWRTICY